MKTIIYESAEAQDETVSALLMMFLEYGKEIGLFVLLSSLVQVKMKTVVYGVLNKAQTVIVRAHLKKKSGKKTPIGYTEK